jgi:amino acid adenylation domain-containing protein
MDDLSAVFFGTTAGLSDSSVRDTSMRVPRLGLKSERTIRWDEIEQSIPDRFEDVVRRYPDHCAVKAGVKAFTYDELNRAANRIAHAIIAHRGESSEPIALLFENGFEGIAAFFGALKARKSAVTLAPSSPPKRLIQILDDSQTRAIVTCTRHIELARTFQSQTRTVLNIDDAPAVSVDNPRLPISPDDLAALLYTSGSTGTPKGVIRAHRNFLHLSAVYTSARDFTVNDKSSLVHSMSFGSAYSDVLPALLNGATLLPFDLKTESMHRFAAWLHEEQVTICHLPPLAFRPLASCLTGQNPLPHLRLLCLSGAPVTRLDFDLYRQHFGPSTLLAIVMGATEACTLASVTVDQHFTFPEEGTPIGRPHEGRTILLVDEQRREVGPGEVGEIAVKGRNLSLGYWRRPDLTREKFLVDPAGGDERIFLTGDLGRRRPDGLFVHLGRKDSLVKIRGYRVELGEVEKALAAYRDVREAAVVAWDRAPGEKSIAAYVVPQPGTAPSVQGLQDWLKNAVPDYMVPSSFVFLASLPLVNGKLDRRALPPPNHQRPALSSEYAAARSALESQLVTVWETVLGAVPVGIHDDFFALGGHSLLGAGMIARVHDTLGADLPLRALFEAPTIAEFAKRIEAREESRTDRKSHIGNAAYLFELQAGDDRPPVFLFPGGGGGEPEFFIYARLARSVGRDYPFYGLRARGADGFTPPHRSVAVMAADYLAEMRMLQPHGPYFLVGECFGGIVAYEVATQLQSEGEQVAVLVLMDTQRPTGRIYWRFRAMRAFGPLAGALFDDTFARHWKTLCTLPYRRWIPYLGKHAAGAARYLPSVWARPESVRNRAQAILESEITGGNRQRVIEARHCYRLTLRRHRPQPYAGPIELFVNEEYHQRDDPSLGWATVARGDVHIRKVPGNHDSYLRELIQLTAEELRACLEDAYRRTPQAHSRASGLVTADATVERVS